MAIFPHLPLIQTITGTHKPASNGRKKTINPITAANIANREVYGRSLIAATSSLKDQRERVISERREAGLPDIPEQTAIPVFLKVDTNLFNIESLKGMGIDIIAEELNGYIIGASTDGFASLQAKIEKFINEDGKYKNQAAQLWEINIGTSWKTEQILCETLRNKWPTILDTEIFTVDISVACYIAIPAQPQKNDNETDEQFEAKIERWNTKVREINLNQADLADAREESIHRFLSSYNADINPESVQFDDSFCFRVTLSGAALRDFVLNYPYVFEVAEYSENEQPISINGQAVDNDLEIIAPTENAPHVCIIDSGIQENHRLLSESIISSESTNYDTFDNTTSDLYGNGGHGTRVAGAVLFGENIPSGGVFQPHCFLLNARVLNRFNQMSSSLYPPALIKDIVNNFETAKIFNMSINMTIPCRIVHMSPWAAMIDLLSHQKGVLFVVSTGNLKDSTSQVTNPGIIEHLSAGRNYPDYLYEASCRISDPAQSKFAITVGSVCLSDFEDLDRISFGKRDQISSFSRTGLGLWGGIKPEVVEYAGDWVREKLGANLSYESSINPLLLRVGGTGVDRNAIGTSFAAPKVTHIASRIQAELPGQNALLYKALVIQSARLPEQVFRQPTLEAIRTFGYGIPNLTRALDNSQRRVTLTTVSSVKPGNANLYTINIPPELRRQGASFDMLIEVTLCFTAIPRRTRRKTQSYLSSWLSWESSKLGESFETFKTRVLKYIDNPDAEIDQDIDTISWSIWSNPLWGAIKGLKRQDSATQKDWVILKSNRLTEQLSFSIIGHKGWEKDLNIGIPFSFTVSIEALEGELEVYENIRLSNQITIEQEITVL